MNQQKSEYKLIVSDLDGTIFDKTYTIEKELTEVVRRARDKGCEFTFATGRLYPSAVQFAAELDIGVPLITYNGAQIRDPIMGKTILEVPVPREKALEIINMTQGHPVMRFVFKDDVVFTDMDEEITKGYAEALRVKFLCVEKLAEIIDKDPTMIALRDKPEEIEKWTVLFRQHFGEGLYLANSRPFFLDIAHPRVSKGYAVKCLSQYLGLNTNQVIAIGDEGNDLEMMATAGLGAAVANASEKVRRSADYVAKAEYWRGVIEVVERFVL